MGGQLSMPITDKATELSQGNGLCFAASGMQGLRREMEDDHTVVTSLEDLAGHSFVAVYDGHGGDATAHIAAPPATGLLKSIRAQPAWQKYAAAAAASPAAVDPGLLGPALHAGFLEFDRGLTEKLIAAQGDASSGATAVCVVITPTHFVCASVGDSRAVLARGDGSCAALSEDHKPSLPDEAARIKAAGGRVLMDRVDGSLAMSRALGGATLHITSLPSLFDLTFGSAADFDLKDDMVEQWLQKVSPVPDIVIVKREATDEALM